MTSPNRSPEQPPPPGGDPPPPYYRAAPKPGWQVWRPAGLPPYEVPDDLPRYEFGDHTEPLPEWAAPPVDQLPATSPPPPYPNLDNAVQGIEPSDEPPPEAYAEDIRRRAMYFDNPEPRPPGTSPGLTQQAQERVQDLEEQADDYEALAEEHEQNARASRFQADYEARCQSVTQRHLICAQQANALAERHEEMAGLHDRYATIEVQHYSTLAERYQSLHDECANIRNEYGDIADWAERLTAEERQEIGEIFDGTFDEWASALDQWRSDNDELIEITRTSAEQYGNEAQRLREAGPVIRSHEDWSEEHSSLAVHLREEAVNHETWRYDGPPPESFLDQAENFELLRREALETAHGLRNEADRARPLAEGPRELARGYRVMADRYEAVNRGEGSSDPISPRSGLTDWSRDRIVEHNRKRRILQLRKEGKSVKEIARVLQIDDDEVERVLGEGPVPEATGGFARWPCGRRGDDDGAGGAGAGGAGAGGAGAGGAGPAWGGSHYGSGASWGETRGSGAGVGRSAAESGVVMYDYPAMQRGGQQLQQVHALSRSTLNKVLTAQKLLGEDAEGAGADAAQHVLDKLAHANQSIVDVLGRASASLQDNTSNMQHIEARLAARFDAGA